MLPDTKQLHMKSNLFRCSILHAISVSYFLHSLHNLLIESEVGQDLSTHFDYWDHISMHSRKPFLPSHNSYIITVKPLQILLVRPIKYSIYVPASKICHVLKKGFLNEFKC